MRSTDARRRERNRPEGVTHGFQVILYKVDPRVDSCARNLFSKDRWNRSAGFAAPFGILLDEVVEGWPQVPLVIKPHAFACRAERLARARSGPNRSTIVPTCSSESEGPNPDSGEEVALCVWLEVVESDIFYASFVYVTECNKPGRD